LTSRTLQPVPFRLVSANLWNGRADADAFAALVDELGADAVAVQELGFGQAEALGRVMPYGQLDPADDYTGLGIALRRPGGVWRLPLPCRDARVTDVSLDGTDDGSAAPIEIVNVHIQAPHFPIRPTTYLQRYGQLRGLQRHLDASPERRRAVVGDFNATPIWPVYRRFAARLTDAAVEWARRHGRRPEPTWAPWPGAPRMLRIDHVFVRGLWVSGFQTIPVAGADHWAIVVDLEVEGRGSRDQGRAGQCARRAQEG
jgi:endonuclease/exonuclease/phosphatase family metal-dependent hydrolase